MRHALLALVFLSMPLLAVEELDVLTLKNGRIVEGIYDPTTGTIEFQGKIKGSLHVDSKEIVNHEKRPAPRAEPVAAKPTDDKPVDPAKKQASIQSQLKAKLRADITQLKDYKALAERNVAAMEQQEKLLPSQIQSVESQLATAKSDLRTSESRLVSVQQDADYWNRWHSYYGWDSSYRSDRGRATTEAEGAKRRAAGDVTKIQRERDKLVADQTRIARDLPQTRIRITEYTQKIADLETQLTQIDAAAATTPAATPAAAAKPGSDGISDIPPLK